MDPPYIEPLHSTAHILVVNMNEGQEEGVPVMQPDLSGIKVAVLCGDAREIILVERLAALGALVKVVDLPVAETNNIKVYQSPVEGLADVHAVILPVPGINDQGEIYTAYGEQPWILSADLFTHLAPNTPVFVGAAKPRLKELVQKAGLVLIEVMQLDEVAILNSIPSAEGALQLAMEQTDITIHGSCTMILGFGRTGMTLARMTHALGAHTIVVVRNFAQKARAQEMGFIVMDYQEMLQKLNQVDIIFNTVPAMVLDEPELAMVSPQTLIVDIASAPGGINFKAANQKGIHAMLAPGLPGKVAPRTAGNILAEVIPRLLAEHMATH